MKNLLSILAISIALTCSAQSITKSITADSTTTLPQQIEIIGTNILWPNKQVITTYRIDILSPNGKIVTYGAPQTFITYNAPAQYGGIHGDSLIYPVNNQWDSLYIQLGPSITGLYQLKDLNRISSVKDLPKLNQQ